MCRCLRIQPSGFYAWLQAPLSQRSQEYKRQTELLQKAWTESGKAYGYRRLHDDLVEEGESICPNRVSRLARLAGIRAQIGYKRRPGSQGGKPSFVVDIEPMNATGSREPAGPRPEVRRGRPR